MVLDPLAETTVLDAGPSPATELLKRNKEIHMIRLECAELERMLTSMQAQNDELLEVSACQEGMVAAASLRSANARVRLLESQGEAWEQAELLNRHREMVADKSVGLRQKAEAAHESAAQAATHAGQEVAAAEALARSLAELQRQRAEEEAELQQALAVARLTAARPPLLPRMRSGLRLGDPLALADARAEARAARSEVAQLKAGIAAEHRRREGLGVELRESVSEQAGDPIRQRDLEAELASERVVYLAAEREEEQAEAEAEARGAALGVNLTVAELRAELADSEGRRDAVEAEIECVRRKASDDVAKLQGALEESRAMLDATIQGPALAQNVQFVRLQHELQETTGRAQAEEAQQQLWARRRESLQERLASRAFLEDSPGGLAEELRAAQRAVCEEDMSCTSARERASQAAARAKSVREQGEAVAAGLKGKIVELWRFIHAANSASLP